MSRTSAITCKETAPHARHEIQDGTNSATVCFGKRVRDYTPTTEEVRKAYATEFSGFHIDDDAKAFDRWLAARDADVLRLAALSGDFGATAQSTLLRHAERIEKGVSA